MDTRTSVFPLETPMKWSKIPCSYFPQLTFVFDSRVLSVFQSSHLPVFIKQSVPLCLLVHPITSVHLKRQSQPKMPSLALSALCCVIPCLLLLCHVHLVILCSSVFCRFQVVILCLMVLFILFISPLRVGLDMFGVCCKNIGFLFQTLG